MKKISLGIGILLLGVIAWYIFIKPYDYLVTFDSKSLPGTINQTVKLWARSLENAELLEQKDLSHFKYQLQFNDSIHSYEWKILPKNDSVFKVKVYIKDSVHSLSNKLSIPFSETNFEKRSKRTLTELTKILSEHRKRIKVTIIGEEDILNKYCAYIPFKSTQLEKANNMMQHYSLLTSVLAKNGVELNGSPFIEVEHWDIEKDSIAYNFCFPIIKTDSLPKDTPLKFKELRHQKAIKAIYNGNYITSDRAWYKLMDYADKKNMNITKKPLEVFHSNPNMGGNELNWKAEIYMPLKE